MANVFACYINIVLVSSEQTTNENKKGENCFKNFDDIHTLNTMAQMPLPPNGTEAEALVFDVYGFMACTIWMILQTKTLKYSFVQQTHMTEIASWRRANNERERANHKGIYAQVCDAMCHIFMSEGINGKN